MKKLNQIVGLFVVTLACVVRAQDSFSTINLSGLSDNGVLVLSGTNISSFNTFSDDELTALVDVLDATATVSTPTLSNGNTMGGTFWSLQNPGMPPLPSDTIGVDVWPMADGSFLLDDWDFDYSGASAGPMGMRAMDSGMSPPGFGDGGGGTNDYTLLNSYVQPDYGTNLWIAQTAVASNYLTGIGSNTVSDVLYTIQSRTNLMQSDWQFEGTIAGSELTNWTPLSVLQNNRTNLFIRLRSELNSDGSGIPDWWEAQYGVTNADSGAQDSAGDGYTIYQKYTMGLNPNVFYTPAAPQGLTVAYNSSNNTATLSWLAVFGNVTNYTIERAYTNLYVGSAAISDIAVAVSSNGLVDNVSSFSADPSEYGTINVSYKIKANFTGGASSWSARIPLEAASFAGSIAVGSEETPVLAVHAMPGDTTGIRLTEIDNNILNSRSGTYAITNFIVSVGSLSGGVGTLPNVGTPTTDGYYWIGQAIEADGSLSASINLGNDSEGSIEGFADDSLATPFYDGRVQLKQNLIFQLRAALADRPFRYLQSYPLIYAHPNYQSFFSAPTNYAYAGYYLFTTSDDGTSSSAWLEVDEPFGENALYRNFAFDSSALDASGFLTTGIGDDQNSINGSLELAITNYDNAVDAAPWIATLNYQIESPLPSNAPALLGSAQTQWLASYPEKFDADLQYEIGITNYIDYSTYDTVFALASDAYNLFGLPVLSVTVADGGFSGTVYAGGTVVDDDDSLFPQANLYPQVAQPKFRTVEYDFFDANNDALPGLPSKTVSGLTFSPTNQSHLIIASVGGAGMQIAGYAKLEVTNGIYTGVYGYLGQYFTNAYELDANGNITPTNTGILSPYGNFLATKPGPVALVTMPDVDTGVQGTCIVYCVSMQVDKNHDGTMDTSLNGSDITSQANPMEFWINNGHCEPANLQQPYDFDEQVPPAIPNYASSQFFPHGQISCQRDLENFARLWLCGMPNLPTNYQVTLSWANVNGAPAINLYNSVETNGGIGYLTETNIAFQQCLGYSSGSSPYSVVFSGPNTGIATIAPTASFTFPASYFTTNGGNNYFLFEGAGIGSGELMLTVSLNGNTIAQTGVWLDLHDIKDFYEQAEAVNVPNGVPPSSLISRYIVNHTTTVASGETPQVVVFVHGINNTEFAYHDTTEVLYKRLYWSGYHGKVSGFRWPCAYLPNDITNPFEDVRAFNFNKGEFYAWKSATAFAEYLSYLRNRPDLTNYTINVFAHSQGNIVASEAIKEGAPFDNYILTQGALPAHCFDTSVPFLQSLLDAETNSPTATQTPFYPANGGYHGYFSGISGNLINFYNTNDYALTSGTVTDPTGLIVIQANWVEDQRTHKPETFIGGPSYVYNPSNQVTTAYNAISSSYTVTDLEEIKSMVARSRSSAVGAQNGVGGVINTGASVDLIVNFGFGKTRQEHSAQFDRPIQTIWGYYDDILTSFKITPIAR